MTDELPLPRWVMLTLILIGVVAGAVTAVSPCVLPVLPVVFFGAGSFAPTRPSAVVPGPDGHRPADSDGHRPAGSVVAARREGAPLIVAGLVLSFAVLTLGGSLLVSALHLPAQVLRWTGLLVLFAVGVGLVVPSVQRVLQRPFTRLPHLDASTAGGPFALGLALGALYVPCAGPVIAAIAIAGATGTVDGGVLVLTAAFAIGTAVPLMVFAYAGDRIGRRVSRFRSGARRFRLAGGLVMIGLAVALTFNLTDVLQRWVPTYTTAIQNSIEGSPAADQALGDLASAATTPVVTDAGGVLAAVDASGPVVSCRSAADALANCGPAPAFAGIDTWINTPGGAPVSLAGLHGKVVLVDFWTFACINCQHVLPQVTSWYDAYRDSGLEVIGVHTPEFTFEGDPDNVRAAVTREGIAYPVGLDNSSTTWRSYGNRYWPAAYLVDAEGTLRYVKFGEGDYQHTESLIRQLLLAANPGAALPDPTTPGS